MKSAAASALRRVCFVTGTRAEFGLMHSPLVHIAAHASLSLQFVATGMHLDRSRGRSIDQIYEEGWKVNAIIPWPAGARDQTATAAAAGKASAMMAHVFKRLRSDIVLVVGDRVEAFAAASAAHMSGRILAHVHGGDRALGIVDDSLRHAITKLSHIHFPATAASAQRIAKMGEDSRRIFRFGSPGLDDVKTTAAPWASISPHFPMLQPRRFALLILHPQSTHARSERELANIIASCVEQAGFDQTLIVYPNNDPGAEGIIAAWNKLPLSPRVIRCQNIPRRLFLGLLRDAAALIGNSSAGIIEAASFGAPVLDIGIRQLGRERGPNVFHAGANPAAISAALSRIWKRGNPIRFPAKNIYGAGGTGEKIADTLASINIDDFRQKLICY